MDASKFIERIVYWGRIENSESVRVTCIAASLNINI